MAVYRITEKSNAISKEILDAAFYIHSRLGPGLLENVYEDCLFHVLKKRGIEAEQQKLIPVRLDDLLIESGFRADLVVADSVIVELKACERILPIHEAQLHTYLKLSGKDLGLILNFNVRSLRDGIKRIAKAQAYEENFV